MLKTSPAMVTRHFTQELLLAVVLLTPTSTLGITFTLSFLELSHSQKELCSTLLLTSPK